MRCGSEVLAVMMWLHESEIVGQKIKQSCVGCPCASSLASALVSQSHSLTTLSVDVEF